MVNIADLSLIVLVKPPCRTLIVPSIGGNNSYLCRTVQLNRGGVVI